MAPDPRPLAIVLPDDPPGPADDGAGRDDLGYLAGQSLAAYEFARRKGDVVRFDHATGEWIIWDGRRWRRDDDAAIRRAWADVQGTRYADAMRSAGDLRKSILDGIRSAGSTDAAIRGGLTIAASMLPVATDGTAWDADPDVIGTADGMIVDLRTGAARPAMPDDLVTKATAVDWGGTDAQAPRWEAFLTETHPDDPELVDWLQRLFGAGLVGRSDELLPIHYGAGSNGKSVALGTIGWILGDYATTVPIAALTDAKRRAGQATPDLIPLRGARFATAAESRTDDRLDDAAVKALASVDRMTGRDLHQRQSTWDPTHTLHVMTNHLPSIGDASDALWRRIALVPWPVRFRAPGDRGDGPMRDVGLRDDVRAQEGPGILAWLVRGAAAYRERGLYPLPESVRVRTAEYRADEDPLGFLDGRLVADPDGTLSMGEVASAYKLATGAEMESRALGKIIGPRMVALGARKGRLGDGSRRYFGVRLLPIDDVLSDMPT